MDAPRCDDGWLRPHVASVILEMPLIGAVVFAVQVVFAETHDDAETAVNLIRQAQAAGVEYRDG